MNSQGVYNISLFKNGLPLTVMVDDKLPTTTNGSLVFAKAVNNILWAVLLEKTYANTHGSYEAITSGHSSAVLRDLTGAPTFTLKLDDENVFYKLKQASKSGFVMTAGGCELRESWFNKIVLRIDEKKRIDDLGIVPSHAYGIIEVVEVLN